MTEIYAIGPLRLDADACVLTRDGVLLPLGKRAVSALTILVRAAPHHVTKTRLLEMAWPGVVVEEGNLAVQILSIRRTLAAVSGSERWLETLPRRGYRVQVLLRRPSELPEGATGAIIGDTATGLQGPSSGCPRTHRTPVPTRLSVRRSPNPSRRSLAGSASWRSFPGWCPPTAW